MITLRHAALILVGLLVGCSSSTEAQKAGQGSADAGPPGAEGSHCHPNGTCNSGLSCLSNLCVNSAGGGGGGHTGASGGTMGSGGAPIAGGVTGAGGANADGAAGTTITDGGGTDASAGGMNGTGGATDAGGGPGGGGNTSAGGGSTGSGGATSAGGTGGPDGGITVDACVPQPCANDGHTCGELDDGCGGKAKCLHQCGAGYVCDSASQGCIPCTPDPIDAKTECAKAGWQCGNLPVTDSCGQAVGAFCAPDTSKVGFGYYCSPNHVAYGCVFTPANDSKCSGGSPSTPYAKICQDGSGNPFYGHCGGRNPVKCPAGEACNSVDDCLNVVNLAPVISACVSNVCQSTTQTQKTCFLASILGIGGYCCQSNN